MRIVTNVGPPAVSRAVLVRLARLAEDALQAARAVSVSGDGAMPSVVRTPAGLDGDRIDRALEALWRAEILRAEPELGFVYPLVGGAIYQDIPPVECGREQKRAAELLMDAGAPAEQVAAHLLAAPPSGEAWVVEVLRSAAADAIRAATPGSAVACLSRALAEPPVNEECARALLALGRARF